MMLLVGIYCKTWSFKCEKLGIESEKGFLHCMITLWTNNLMGSGLNFQSKREIWVCSLGLLIAFWSLVIARHYCFCYHYTFEFLVIFYLFFIFFYFSIIYLLICEFGSKLINLDKSKLNWNGIKLSWI